MRDKDPRDPVAAGGRVAAPQAPEAGAAPVRPKREGVKRYMVGLGFLAPALIVLGALVVYPMFFTVVRSLYDSPGSEFVAFENYDRLFSSGRTLTAVTNSAIWVAVVPPVVTALGLIFAVLTERIRWATAFKVAIFMPLAISFLSAGVIWRLVYEREPELGLLNAGLSGVVEVFQPPGDYPGGRPSEEELLETQGRAYVTTEPVSPGETVNMGLIAIRPDLVPRQAEAAVPEADAVPDGISGVVWLDFTPGGEGESGVIDEGETGLPGIEVEALRGTEVAGSAVTGNDGSYVLEGLSPGEYTIRLASTNFREPWDGIPWLGPTLVTPSVIGAYVWIYVGFAMVIIGAGLAALPRDVLEAARVDGASEWQVFRRVTVPLLAPVLGVVFVTLMISALKVFDLIIVLPPFSTQADANVLAVEMWRQSFGGARNQGLGSAVAVFLFVLVIPVMLLNVRRFRREG